MQSFIFLLLLLCSFAWTSAFVTSYTAPASSLLGSTIKQSSSLLSAFDLAVAENIASAAVLPTAFVGMGSYLLINESEEKEAESASSAEKSEDGEVDIYRDTFLRYAGYANEVGEAFAPLVPHIVVPASYGVSITYVVADTIDKTRKCLNAGLYEKDKLTTCALIEGLDALIWQLAASVVLPGYTIHQVVVIVVALLTAAGVYSDDSTGFIIDIPTACGLAAIPLIVKPLDELAEVGMDLTFRKLMKPYLESCEI